MTIYGEMKTIRSILKTIENEFSSSTGLQLFSVSKSLSPWFYLCSFVRCVGWKHLRREENLVQETHGVSRAGDGVSDRA